MTDKETELEIVRLYHAEGWRPGEIASALDVHVSVVNRLIVSESKPHSGATRRRKVDPYIGFLKETIERYPTVTAARLYFMVYARGYTGKQSQLRAIIAKLRPTPTHTPYLRLEVLPGEEGQVDWGHFGALDVGQTKVPLYAFVMVLSHSRALYLRFYHSMTLSSFFDGHHRAFEWFGGVPRRCLYDNLKSVVLERRGSLIRYNEQFLSFAAAYRFEPRAVEVRKGNQKGRVERGIRFVRDRFFTARTWSSLGELNTLAEQWCATESLERTWKRAGMTIRQALDNERPLLLALPEHPYPLEERIIVAVGKTPYVRVDRNDYSVPPAYVSRSVTVLASPDIIRVVDGLDEVARHQRSYERHQTFTDRAHLAALRAERQNGYGASGIEPLQQRIPSVRQFAEASVAQGASLSSVIRTIEELADTYGDVEVEATLHTALAGPFLDPKRLRQLLDAQRAEEGRQPCLLLRTVPRISHRSVSGATLSDYATLNGDSKE